MEQNQSSISFFGRIALAFRVLFDSELARRAASLSAPERPAPAAPPERVHASGLLVLNAFQREGRLIDFLQQDVAAFSDEEVGAAARVVHGGCRRVLQQYFELQPATPEAEGSAITVPQGFDAGRLRLTGNVSGSPPFRGTVKHHGWIAKEIRLPALSDAMDPRVVAPAEVELA
ncbi:MAG TPA: DUF2760 domain-containing protein [Dongiaceae bacterium]|nr:conserved hypothetical protein [Verrucomicrobiota bacterium]HXP61010.1 DUF2760 domain-containing protein [Dongiaceae bacterium]